MVKQELVSIGVPTCNRASYLERALRSLLAQEYANLEIIVSDNASEDRTAEVCRQLMRSFPQVAYYRTPRRVTAFENFRNALIHARGGYFMWAADDDLWEPRFVSTLANELLANPDLMLVASEARYLLEDGSRLPYFPEGKAYYDSGDTSRSPAYRVLRVLCHNYGNLIYGLYRREALLSDDGGTALDMCKRSSNEIPIFVHVAARGRIEVREDILFYKTTKFSTFLQAAREFGFRQASALGAESGSDRDRRHSDTDARSPSTGKRLRSLNVGGLWNAMVVGIRSTGSLLNYHFNVLADVRGAIFRQQFGQATKLILTGVAASALVGHFIKLAVVWPMQDLASRRTETG